MCGISGELSNGGIPGCIGAEGGVFFVFTGTAANVLGLSLLLRPFEAVICAESAHLNVDECRDAGAGSGGSSC